MQLTIERDALAAAVAAVQGVAAQRSTIPILQDVLLQATGETLEIRANDTEMEARASAGCRVGREGAAAVPARVLHDLLRGLPEGGEIAMELSESGVQLGVRCAGSRARLPVLPSADFPRPKPIGKGATRGAIGARDLLRLINRTAFACGKDETRWMLTGVHLAVAEGPEGLRLRAAGCQPTLIAWADMACPAGLTALPPVSLGPKLVAELTRCLDNRTGEVELHAEAERISVDAGDVVLTAPLLDGHQPSYWAHFEPRPLERLTVRVDALKAALGRCLLVAELTPNDKVKGVRLAVSAGSLQLRGSSYELGAAEEEIAVDYAGPGFELGLNGPQFQKMLVQVTADTCELGYGDAGRPLMLFDPGDPNCGFLTAGLLG